MKHELIIDFDIGTIGETSGVIIKDIRCPYKEKLEAIKKLCEEELEALKDYDAKVEKFIYRQILRKILEDQSSGETPT